MNYLSKSNKKSIIVQCDAYDFDTIQFTIEDYGDDDYGMWISILEAEYYNQQNSTLFRKILNRLKLCFDILCGNEHHLFDLYIRKDNMQEFKEYVNEQIK